MKNIITCCFYIALYFLGFSYGLMTLEVAPSKNLLFAIVFSFFLYFLGTYLELRKENPSGFGILKEISLLVAAKNLGQLSFMLVKNFYIERSP